MKLRHLFVVASLLCPLAASAHEYDAGNLHIDHPWSRELPPNAPNVSAYFTVHNKGDSADRLLGADTPVAEKAELHEHIHKDGLMKMQHVQAVDVPAGGEAVFAPMGYHVMLFGPKQALKEGDRFPLTLHFEKAGDVKVEVAVQKNEPEQHEHMHAH
ncbi:copper chaperone PCu(A)C [Pseudomonas sp. LRF_L74]|uniref:copper chaperone PCu(A)C n=1 Tax=Pseudomonas sp. LRF_L74 TaxID=3369422 RepID=UPI003F638E7E